MMLRRSLVVVVLLLLPLAAAAQQQALTAQSPDKARVATAKDRIINITDARTGKALISIRAHAADISALAYAPDGKLLGSADGSGKVHLIDAATGRMLRTLKAAPGVNVLAFSPDGRKLEIKAPGATMTFDVATGKQEK